MDKLKLGKHIGSVVYFHRKYENRMVPDEILGKAKAILPKDFEYTYLKYDKKTGAISFMYSPDFDTAQEPLVTAGYRVTDGKAKKLAMPDDPDKQQIIHGKHLFVDDDYKGFDRNEARMRCDSYQGRQGMDKSRMGRMRWWKDFMGEDVVDNTDCVGGCPMFRSAIMEAVALVTEAVSYTYTIPDDREKRLYDFYLLSLYHGYMFEPGGARRPNYDKRINTLPGMGEDTIKDLEDIVKTGIKELADEIKRDLLSALVTAVAAEFRHVWDGNGSSEIQKFMEKQGVFEQFKKFARHYHSKLGEKSVPDVWKRTGERKEGSSDSYDAASKAVRSSGWDPASFMKVASSAFVDLGWSSLYGGEKWKDIADSWGKLNSAQTIEQKQIWIDHVFDLEHNTGTMLNKVTRFRKKDKDVGYAWIKQALDAKFAMTPIQLARASSIPMSVVGRLNRISGVSGTVEDHDKSKNPKQKQKDKKPKDPVIKSGQKTDRKFFNVDVFGDGFIILVPNKRVGKIDNVILKKDTIEITHDQGSTLFNPSNSMHIEEMLTFFSDLGMNMERSKEIVYEILSEHRKEFDSEIAKLYTNGWSIFGAIELNRNPKYSEEGTALRNKEEYDFKNAQGNILGLSVSWGSNPYVAVNGKHGNKKFNKDQYMDFWNALDDLGSLRPDAYDKLYKKAFGTLPKDPVALKDPVYENSIESGDFLLVFKYWMMGKSVFYEFNGHELPIDSVVLNKENVVFRMLGGEKHYFAIGSRGKDFAEFMYTLLTEKNVAFPNSIAKNLWTAINEKHKELFR